MNKTERRALGRFMKNQRKQLGLRQSDLASILLVSQSKISCIENGQLDKDIKIFLDYINLIINYKRNAK